METSIGYIRRSAKSADRTVSLEVQRDAIQAHADKGGYEIAQWVIDDGVSGSKRSRYERIEEALRAHSAKACIIYHLDRFARDVAAQLDVLERWNARGIDLIVAGKGRVSTEDATGFLTTGVEALLAEHYRRLVSEKTRDALARLRAQGKRYSNKVPYGYKLRHTSNLVENEEEQVVLTIIHRRRAQGASLRAIATELLDQGKLARSGKPFAVSTLAKLVRRGSTT